MEKTMRLLLGLILVLALMLAIQMGYDTGSNIIVQHSPIVWLLIAGIYHLSVVTSIMLLTVLCYRIKFPFWTGISEQLLRSMNVWDYLFIPVINIINLVYVIFKCFKYLYENAKRNIEANRPSAAPENSFDAGNT